jgi:DNA-binding CsgD family transcriptional regulator
MLRLGERALTLGHEAGLPQAELAEAQQHVAHAKVYIGVDANLVSDLLATLRTPMLEKRFPTAALAGLAATAAYYAPVPDQLAELGQILDRLPDPFTCPEAWDEPRSADAMLFFARCAIAPFARRSDPLPDRGIMDSHSFEFSLPMGWSMFGAAAYLLDQPELAAEIWAALLRHRSAQPGAGPASDPTFLNTVASNNGMWGRWAEAATQADEVIELATERGERFNVAFGHIIAGMVAVLRGRTEEARRHARAADRASDGISRSVQARTRHLLGLIALTDGDYQSAYTLLRSTLLTEERVPAHFHQSHYAVADFALAAQLTSQQDDAARVLDGLLEHANAMTPGGAHLSQRLRLLHELARALIADGPPAEALFRQALSSGAERWPFDRAWAELHFGAYLRRARRIAEARPLLAAALGTFRDLGAVPWAQRAETELAAAGATPDSGSAPDPAPGTRTAFAVLTPQQRAVAELAARGLTNPQIGARLSISPKTVSIHLSRVFAQLNITSRARLRDFAPDTAVPPGDASGPG